MTIDTAQTDVPHGLFGVPAPEDQFSGLADPEAPRSRQILTAVAGKIGATRRPGASSDIPAGATYLAQFVVHDLDFLTREGTPERSLLDLALIYGDGPRHDAFAYQVPVEGEVTRHLLRVGRARPTSTSPAWGAARDLPRASCPHLDARAAETRSEVLVPNTFSDSNALLGQVQVLWMLMHNAIAATLIENRSSHDAFALARRINRGIYRDAIRSDLLGTWLLPKFRDRYTDSEPRRITAGPLGVTPREFMSGVARIGHGLVREIYALNDAMPVTGLRDLVRHTSTGRPHDMPLTEDWLLDFSRFFAIGSSVPQRARAIGPHVARAFASAGVGTAGSADGLVLRDLISCSRGDLRSVSSLIARTNRSEPGILKGCFAQDGSRWQAAAAEWLADVDGLEPDEAKRLAADPPLNLFLMLEAEADSEGRTLGALGSVLMGETICAAMPAAEDDPVITAARREVFGDRVPATMAEAIAFLQSHYKFADGARLHTSPDAAMTSAPHPASGGASMLDSHAPTKDPIPRIEVADFIEMGKMVALWVAEPETRPTTVDELRRQLDGIAVVPDRIKKVEFCQSTLDTLVLRLPVKEMIDESIENMSDPMTDTRYPLPQFYSDFYRPGFGPVLTPLDTLMARVGDYTIAQCR